jgi:hypothetical protein
MSGGPSVPNPWLPFVVAIVLLALYGFAVGFVGWESWQLTKLANTGVAGVDARLQLWMGLATTGLGVLGAAFTSAVGFFFGNRGAEGARAGEVEALRLAGKAECRAEVAEARADVLRNQVLQASGDLVRLGGPSITPLA